MAASVAHGRPPPAVVSKMLYLLQHYQDHATRTAFLLSDAVVWNGRFSDLAGVMCNHSAIPPRRNLA